VSKFVVILIDCRIANLDIADGRLFVGVHDFQASEEHQTGYV